MRNNLTNKTTRWSVKYSNNAALKTKMIKWIVSIITEISKSKICSLIKTGSIAIIHIQASQQIVKSHISSKNSQIHIEYREASMQITQFKTTSKGIFNWNK